MENSILNFLFVFRISSVILTVLPVILLSTIFILNIKDLETNKSKQISFLLDPDPMSNDWLWEFLLQIIWLWVTWDEFKNKVQIFSYFDLELELELGHRGWCLARLWIKKSNQSADTPLQTGFSASVLNKDNIVQIMD